MDETKTVGYVGIDLYNEQVKDVAAMRTSLLSFNKRDPNAARKALQNVVMLRVYHQLERIVRYTEMMDKLEDRIYQSIDAKLNNSDPDDDSLWFTLIPIQERLQKVMIDSHKLLEPYLNMEQLATFEVPVQEDPANSFASMILDQDSREKVRTSAQELLAAIDMINSSENIAESKVESKEPVPESKELTPELDVQTKAADLLSQITEE